MQQSFDFKTRPTESSLKSILQRETPVVITRRTHAHCQIAAIGSSDCFCTSGNSGYRSRKASATQPAPCY